MHLDGFSSKSKLSLPTDPLRVQYSQMKQSSNGTYAISPYIMYCLPRAIHFIFQKKEKFTFFLKKNPHWNVRKSKGCPLQDWSNDMPGKAT